MLLDPSVTNCHTFSDPLPSSVTYFMDGPCHEKITIIKIVCYLSNMHNVQIIRDYTWTTCRLKRKKGIGIAIVFCGKKCTLFIGHFIKSLCYIASHKGTFMHKI